MESTGATVQAEPVSGIRAALSISLAAMSEGHSSTPGRVVIVGGGVAGLEALIALRALVGDDVSVTLVSQDDWFVDRPLTVAEPFALGSAARHSLPEIAAELGAQFVHATVSAVAADEHRSAARADRTSASTR